MKRHFLWNEDDLLTLQRELTEIYSTTPVSVRNIVSASVKVSAPALVERFYAAMLAQPSARFFLNHDLVRQRLMGAMRDWLVSLFRQGENEAREIIRRQLEVGHVHARSQVPVSLVMQGFRELKKGLYLELERTRLQREQFALAICFVSVKLDLALGVMTAAYIGSSERAVRSDEALRLFSIGQDLAAERERQRATLAEWAQLVFFDTHMADGNRAPAGLAQSEFGLWFFHRAELLFGQSAEYAAIAAEIGRIDEILQALNVETAPRDLLREIKQHIDRIASLLNMLFERLQVGSLTKDPLTQLLSRRFLLTAVSREIALQKTSTHPFSLIMFEIDRFSELRTRLGEARSDQLAQQTATLLFNAARSSDSVFGMRREAFLIIRVESDAYEATKFAQGIVERFMALHLEVDGQIVAGHSLSFGLVEYDGHPDPRHLVQRAEEALRSAPR